MYRICFVQFASLRAQFYVLAKGSTRSVCPQREAKTWLAKSSFPVLKNWISDEAEQCGNAVPNLIGSPIRGQPREMVR